MHGGDDGELPATGTEHQNGPYASEFVYDKACYIFEHTYEEIRAHHKQTKYWRESPQDEGSMVCEVW